MSLDSGPVPPFTTSETWWVRVYLPVSARWPRPRWPRQGATSMRNLIRRQAPDRPSDQTLSERARISAATGAGHSETLTLRRSTLLWCLLWLVFLPFGIPLLVALAHVTSVTLAPRRKPRRRGSVRRPLPLDRVSERPRAGESHAAGAGEHARAVVADSRIGRGSLVAHGNQWTCLGRPLHLHRRGRRWAPAHGAAYCSWWAPSRW